MVELPTLIAHADWSVNPAKRWMACAQRQADGSYLAHLPHRVGETGTLIARLRQLTGERGSLLLGFDFPIGLPLDYAQKAGITKFLEFLTEAGKGRWIDFYKPAEKPEEIRLERPFYPQKPGGTRRTHLLNGLGVQSMQALTRHCEQAHASRRAACPLFWTLGGQQVGKAAICGWQEVLAPGLNDEELQLAIWPFAGHFEGLLHPGSVIITETYPREFYTPLGIKFKNLDTGRVSGKRDPAARRNNREHIIQVAEAHAIHIDPDLLREITDGFGPDAGGEDPFDAVIGLFGILITLRCQIGPSEPSDEDVRNIEGWIFGQK